MRNRTDKKGNAKKWTIVGAIILGIALLLFVGQYVFTQWLQRKLEKTVQQQTEGVYKLELYGLETSPFIGNASVDSLSLTPDYNRWQQLKEQQKDVSRTLIDLKSKSISLNRLNYFKMLFQNTVDLDSLVVQQPDLLMTVMLQDTTPKQKPLYETVKGFLNGLKVGKIKVRQANLHFRKGAGSDTLFSVRRFRLAVTDFALDSASFHTKDKAYYAQKYSLAAAGASYRFPDKTYEFSTDSVLINTEEKSLALERVKLAPLFEPVDLARIKDKAVTHQGLEVKEISLRGVDFREYFRSNNIKVKYGLLQSPSLIAFKDKKSFKDKGSKQLPHEMVQDIKASFLIDSLELKNGYVRYSELVPGATERGHITLNKFNASAANLTNIPGQISMENPAVVRASMMIMDKASFEITMRLPLLDENGYHTFEGEIGDGSLQLLNPILVPTAFIRMESGYVSGGHFRVELNQTKAEGTMTARYSNLEVELLNKGSGGEQGLGKEVLSELADWVAIKDSNPSEGEQLRTGKIMVTRDPQKSVFNYWRQCLVSGFLSSIGLEGMAKK